MRRDRSGDRGWERDKHRDRDRERDREDVNDIPSRFRRLDSIGWLIQGRDKCGAACFDGEKLLLATNNIYQSNLVKDITKYLTNVSKKANTRYKTQETSNIPQEEWDNDIYNAAKNVEDKYERDFKNIGTYFRDFSDALYKATNSIILAYSEPANENAFAKDLVEALEKKRYRFVHGKVGVHAEMKVIQNLMEEKKIGNKDVITEQIYYVGISKKCCYKCEKMIEAINETMEEMELASVKEIVEIRDGHRRVFSAGIPEFVAYGNDILDEDIRREIRNKFIQKMRADSLTEAFERKEEGRIPPWVQVHRRSRSPAEILKGVKSPKPREILDQFSADITPLDKSWKESEKGKEKSEEEIVEKHSKRKKSTGREEELNKHTESIREETYELEQDKKKPRLHKRDVKEVGRKNWREESRVEEKGKGREK